MGSRRRSMTPELTLADFSLEEHLCFLSAWRPPTVHDRGPRAGRWTDWRGFLADYEQIRDELYERFADRIPHLQLREPFGERVRRFALRYGAQELASVATTDEILIDGAPEAPGA